MIRCCVASFCFALCVFQCGCAVYDPYRLWRWTFDFNTEREFAAQAVVYEHLPPRPVRTRLTTWAYNPGPAQSTVTMPAPVGPPAIPPATLPLPPEPAAAAVRPISGTRTAPTPAPPAPTAAWLFSSP